MHCVTSAIFLASFISQPWISKQNKLRILEWKGRVDLMMYASRGAAELRREEITSYKSKLSWEEVFAQAINHPREDGHASKFVRTLAYGEKLCKPFELDEKYQEAFLVRGDMWIKLANMGEFFNSGFLKTNRLYNSLAPHGFISPCIFVRFHYFFKKLLLLCLRLIQSSQSLPLARLPHPEL